MPSGWEKSPDYGGRDPTPFEWVIMVVVLVGVTAFLVWGQMRSG